MKIGILKGFSTNHVLGTFAEGLAQGIHANGHAAEVLDVTHDEALGSLINTLRGDGYDAVIAFNAMLGEVVGPEQRSILEHAGIPYIGWLVDHPAYHYRRLTAPNQYRWTLCPSSDHIEFLNGAGVQGLWQFLLAAAEPHERATEDFSNRRIPILFAATWMQEPDKFWERISSEPTRSIIENVVERLMDDSSVSVVQAFKSVLHEHGLPLDIDASVARIIAALLYYIRKHDRLNLVRHLAQSGLPVTLYGKGWKENLACHGRLDFIPDVPVAELNRRYADARFVVNINAANGASERAFAAMQAGACVLSDQNELLAQMAEPGSDIIFFDRRRPADLVQLLGDLLESDDGEAIAQRGMQRARAEHTWTNRGAQLLQWLAETSDQDEFATESA